MSNQQGPTPPVNEINIELPDNIADGTYANLSIISHSDGEFVLDFVRVMPNLPKARVKSRVIVSPSQAKRLLNALQENIQRYERSHGTIQDPGQQQMPFPMNFNTPKGQA